MIRNRYSAHAIDDNVIRFFLKNNCKTMILSLVRPHYTYIYCHYVEIDQRTIKKITRKMNSPCFCNDYVYRSNLASAIFQKTIRTDSGYSGVYRVQNVINCLIKKYSKNNINKTWLQNYDHNKVCNILKRLLTKYGDTMDSRTEVLAVKGLNLWGLLRQKNPRTNHAFTVRGQ